MAMCYSLIESTPILEDDAECVSLSKLTKLVKLLKLIELVKKPSSLIRTRKEKPESVDALNLLASGGMLKKNYQ